MGERTNESGPKTSDLSASRKLNRGLESSSLEAELHSNKDITGQYMFWSERRERRETKTNLVPGLNGSSNIVEIVLPLLGKLENELPVFGGDLSRVVPFQIVGSPGVQVDGLPKNSEEKERRDQLHSLTTK
jgi:hypothetical protein